jgi:ABC-2 type transport system ATP-binding protein
VDPAAAPAAAAALAPMADEEPVTEEAIVSFSVHERRGALVHAVQAMVAAGIEVDDIAVRRPTLDDVFLSLTGRAAEEQVEEEETGA